MALRHSEIGSMNSPRVAGNCTVWSSGFLECNKLGYFPLRHVSSCSVCLVEMSLNCWIQIIWIVWYWFWYLPQNGIMEEVGDCGENNMNASFPSYLCHVTYSKISSKTTLVFLSWFFHKKNSRVKEGKISLNFDH